jgi:hypothetical protein
MVPCKFFIKGHCKRGGNCRYSHEATPSTSNPSKPPPPALQPDTSKGWPWSEQHLFTPATSSTTNSLSPNPLQSIQPVSQNSLAFRIRKSDPAHLMQDSRSQIPCYHYTRGNCRNGSACPYSHLDGGEQMVEATSNSEVCSL